MILAMGTITASEIRQAARDLYIETGLDMFRPPGGVEVARRVEGITIEIMDDLLRRSRLRANDNGQGVITGVIELSGYLSANAAHWKALHELWEFKLTWRRKLPFVSPRKERFVDNLAAETTAPTDALEAAVARVGLDVPRLARMFHTSQTILAMRLGEALRYPIALVGMRGKPVRRGPDVLPYGDDLVRVVLHGRDGYRVSWLTDGPRAALVIAE
jgi:hypothetical protein